MKQGGVVAWVCPECGETVGCMNVGAEAVVCSRCQESAAGRDFLQSLFVVQAHGYTLVELRR